MKEQAKIIHINVIYVNYLRGELKESGDASVIHDYFVF
jgi:hypothetical protein